MATLHLIEGPVGAGKSTFAAKLALAKGAVHLDLDAWMVTLFSPDRPEEGFMQWYGEMKSRCIAQIWSLSSELIDRGVDAVLELGLVQTRDREEFYHRVDGTDYDLRVYLLDTPEAVRRERVKQRNAEQSGTYKMVVSDEIFEMANSFWQAPGEAECRDRQIEVITPS